MNREIEQLGATVKAQWATLGQFDFVNVVEAPDEKTIARVSLELGSRGTGKYETLTRDPDRRLHRLDLSDAGAPARRPADAPGSARARRRPARGSTRIVQALKRSPQGPRSSARPETPGIADDAPCSISASRTSTAWSAAAAGSASTSSSSGRRYRWWRASQMRWRRRGSAASARARRRRALEGSKAFCKEVMAAAGVPTAGYAVVDRRRGGPESDHALSRGDQGRRSGCGQGRDHRRGAKQQAREALESCSCSGASGPSGW